MTNGSPESKDRLDFLWKVHGYTNDYIRFADQKAGLILAIQSGLVAALYAAKLHHACGLSKLCFHDATLRDTLVGAITLAAFLGLLLGIKVAVTAIAPKLWIDFRPSQIARLRKHLSGDIQKAHIYWKQVLQFPDKEGFFESLSEMDEGARVKEVANHVFTLAGIADTKYDRIDRSIFWGTVGASFAVLALFVG